MIKTLFLTAAMVLALSKLEANETLPPSPCKTLPGELCAFVKQSGFFEIKDFFTDERRMQEPPFIYGVAPGAKFESVAVFAKDKKGEVFLLSAMRPRGKKGWGKALKVLCEPVKVASGGLSVETHKTWSLRGYNCLTKPKAKAPSESLNDVKVIEVDEEGAGCLYVLWDGAWWESCYD